MKYLLKQQINRKTIDDTVKVYPGNPGLIRLANKLEIEYTEMQKQEGKYCITQYYLFDKEDYFQVLSQYKNQINEKRNQFWNQDPIVQLIKLLKYIFKRNTRAKEVEKYSATQNAYNDKNQFLEIALKIAKDISYPFFSYGYGEDPWNDYHHYLYYFEIENVGQVSFHSEKLFKNVPEFPGKWIGKINEKFPFNLKDIKKFIKSEV